MVVNEIEFLNHRQWTSIVTMIMKTFAKERKIVVYAQMVAYLTH